MSETQSILTHGVTRKTTPENEIGYICEEIRRNGYAVVENMFSKDEMLSAKKTLYNIYDQQVSEIGGIEQLRKINDVNIVRTPLVYDDFFVEMAADDMVLSIVRELLGRNVSLSSQVGIINSPNFKNYQEAWHRELQYQHFTSSSPLAIQSLVAIDDFTAENGGTFFLSGSHLFEEFPSDRFVQKTEVQLEAPSGSAILFDSMVYHRGAPNKTSCDRLAVNNLYTLPIIHQQIDIAQMLNGRFSDDPTHRQLFGYEWNPAQNINDWRLQRIERVSEK